MNRLFVMCVAALLIAALQTTGAQQGTAQLEKQLARAHHKATVDGDLPGAIEEYKQIVAAAGSNRTIAAQALVRMAECYQKLGDAEARHIYERVFATTQIRSAGHGRAHAAGTRHRRLAAGVRAVWTGPRGFVRPGVARWEALDLCRLGGHRQPDGP